MTPAARDDTPAATSSATPAAARPALARICKKLVLKGHASSSGASYTLYLKVEVPSSQKPHTYPLLPDHEVRLKDAAVHPLDAAGAAPALSESAAAAAAHLGIPLSVHHGVESPPLLPTDGRSTPTARRRSSIGGARRPPHDLFASSASNAQVSVSNFHINFITPPLTTPLLSPPSETAPVTGSTPKRKRKDVCGFILILRMEVGLAASPPRSAYMVRLPKPYCLNNYLKFALDDSVNLGTGNIAVEIDPLILPRSRSQRRALNRPKQVEAEDDDDAITLGPNSDDSDADDDEDDDENTTVQGPFESCDAVVVRWAAPEAGDFVSSSQPSHRLASALRADRIDSRICYEACTADDGDHAAFRFEATADLTGLYFPGLDAEASMPIVLDLYGQEGTWDVSKVEAGAGLVSWAQQEDVSGAKDEEDSADQADIPSNGGPDDASVALLRRSRSTDSLDDDDLLSVAPPSGLSDANIDFSFDSTAAPSRPKVRRRSIVARGGSRPATPLLDESSSTAGDGAPQPASVSRLTVRARLSVADLMAAGSSTTLLLSGTIRIKPKQGQLPTPAAADEIKLALPVLRFPTASEHFTSIDVRLGKAAGTSTIVSDLRRSQWTGSDGRIKLEPHSYGQSLPPGHGFDAEASVVTITAAEVIDVEDATAAIPDGAAATEPSDSALGTDSRLVRPLALAEKSTSTIPDRMPAPPPASVWSREAAFWVHPVLDEGRGFTLSVRLQFDWPSSRGHLLPSASLDMAPAEGGRDPLAAFVNGRHVDLAVGSTQADDPEDVATWRIDLPPELVGCTGSVRADLLLAMPWAGRPDIALRLPSFRWNTMAVSIDLVGDSGRRATLSGPAPRPMLVSQAVTGGVRLYGLRLDSGSPLDVAFTLEAPVRSEQEFRVESDHTFQAPSGNDDSASLAPPVELKQLVATSAPKRVTASQPSLPAAPWPPQRRRAPLSMTSMVVALVSFFAWYSFHALWPFVQDLNEKVGFLATAQNIDFYDGSYGLTPVLDTSSEAPWHRRLFETLAGTELRQSRFDDIAVAYQKLQREMHERERRHEEHEAARQPPVDEATPLPDASAPTASVTASGEVVAGKDQTEATTTTRPKWDAEESRRFFSSRKLEREAWMSQQRAAEAERRRQASMAAASATASATADDSATAARATGGNVALARNDGRATGVLSMALEVLRLPVRVLRALGRALMWR
ncbi:uncharacterized protein PFL1_04910 [Pseudozyma flocculosa PF-1]|uniref:Uncharacterized protein n=2 Tax=Pseudozyma flocculosa TaxID=84751 RepID=A0A5C3EVD1_9BASI|nr:uncharacterized protein PFL1_04910 [Pseudozyma flocculosa PF-1]EPQ27371.1 hypothetical protein PFL1_04910 [Pseudozyma flocculosa PF-1]SPO36214.1 uncharacterized protein PSFLO_01685 [Pseudozyma flocculosa]